MPRVAVAEGGGDEEREHLNALRQRGRLLTLLSESEPYVTAQIQLRTGQVRSATVALPPGCSDRVRHLQTIIQPATFGGDFAGSRAGYFFRLVAATTGDGVYDCLEIKYGEGGEATFMYGDEGPQPAYWREPGSERPTFDRRTDFGLPVLEDTAP